MYNIIIKEDPNNSSVRYQTKCGTCEYALRGIQNITINQGVGEKPTASITVLGSENSHFFANVLDNDTEIFVECPDLNAAPTALLIQELQNRGFTITK